MKTKDIIQALYNYYSPRNYLCIHELLPGTGVNLYGGIDFWCMHEWPSHGHERMAFEVKVSRSDFLREKRKPHKQDRAIACSNKIYYVTPVGLLRPGEVSDPFGLIEISEAGELCYVRHAPRRESDPASWTLTASIMRRILKVQRHYAAPKVEADYKDADEEPEEELEEALPPLPLETLLEVEHASH